MENVLVSTSKSGEGKWFESLWDEQELTDVTLVCKDGSQLMAHKTVLALSSPLLKMILTSSKRADPILLLLNTDALVLERLLRLVYFGEVSLLYFCISEQYLCISNRPPVFLFLQGESVRSGVSAFLKSISVFRIVLLYFYFGEASLLAAVFLHF